MTKERKIGYNSKMMEPIYKRNTVYTFFIAMFLIIPVIVMFLSMQFILGTIILFISLILAMHHFGIKFNEKENEIIVYSGWGILHKIQKKIKLSSVTSFKKSRKIINQSYNLPISSYNTSIRSYCLEIEINKNTWLTLVTGTEKSIDRIIEVLKRHN